MQHDFTSILGESIEAVEKSPFVSAFKERTNIKKIEDRFYLQLPNSGITISADNDHRVTSIFFYSEGEDGFKMFNGPLPEGVSFTDSRSSIRTQLGKPSISGEIEVIRFYGKSSPWDRYDRSLYSLHIRYNDDQKSIKLVTLMRPDAVPR